MIIGINNDKIASDDFNAPCFTAIFYYHKKNSFIITEIEKNFITVLCCYRIDNQYIPFYHLHKMYSNRKVLMADY